jgi:hypothetical protein
MRKASEIDFAAIVEARRQGLSTLAEVARKVGVPRQTLQGGLHRERVEDAMERGRILQKLDVLAAYDGAIRRCDGRSTGLLIFAAKAVCGWRDRPAPTEFLEVSAGLRERIQAAAEALRARWAAEGRAGDGRA